MLCANIYYVGTVRGFVSGLLVEGGDNMYSPSTEATSPAWNALPTFQAGEIVSVEGDTRGRG